MDDDSTLSDENKSQIEQFAELDYDGYKVTGYIGHGVTSYVLRAEKGKDTRALKIPKERAFHSAIIESAGYLSQLKGHKNVVELLGNSHRNYPMLDFPYFLMELVDGNSLEGMVQETMNKGLDVKEAIPILAGTAECMQYAHSLGIYHYDLLPKNILVSMKNVPKITDFGLHKVAIYYNKELLEFEKNKPREEYDPIWNIRDNTEILLAPLKEWLPKHARETGEFTPKVDLHQFGKTAFYALYGFVPHTSEGNLPISSNIGTENTFLADLLNKLCQDKEEDIKTSFSEISKELSSRV